jgi:hypothetical protein
VLTADDKFVNFHSAGELFAAFSYGTPSEFVKP